MRKVAIERSNIARAVMKIYFEVYSQQSRITGSCKRADEQIFEIVSIQHLKSYWMIKARNAPRKLGRSAYMQKALSIGAHRLGQGKPCTERTHTPLPTSTPCHTRRVVFVSGLCTVVVSAPPTAVSVWASRTLPGMSIGSFHTGAARSAVGTLLFGAVLKSIG